MAYFEEKNLHFWYNATIKDILNCKTTKTRRFRMKHIPFQLELVPDLPNIVGNKDYKDFRKLLERIEEVLIFSGFEDLAVQSFI